MLKLSSFDYDLPKELIAQYPLKERDMARLLVLNRAKGTIEHCIFKDVVNYLNKDDLLVLNDTKVLRSRLIGKRQTGGRVEILLLKRKNNSTFEALIKPNRVKLKERIIFNGGEIFAELTSKNEVTFNVDNPENVYNLGVMPLPPYIKRDSEILDDTYYQTIYAKQDGAVASPTAGLHFTEGLLKKIKSSGVNIAHLTLHVGIGTFKPVKAEDITHHKMEAEYFTIPKSTEDLLRETSDKNGRVIATGTTSLRALESYASGIREGYTDIFIYPGYKFKIADCILTNFHLPRTTLFILVCAFAGEKLIKKAYQEAIDNKYRFYSYGDAMLIL